jgi:hypothetical protein
LRDAAPNSLPTQDSPSITDAKNQLRAKVRTSSVKTALTAPRDCLVFLPAKLLRVARGCQRHFSEKTAESEALARRKFFRGLALRTIAGLKDQEK